MKVVLCELMGRHSEACEALPAQVRDVGFDITVRSVDVGTLYGKQYLSWPFDGDWYTNDQFWLLVEELNKAFTEPLVAWVKLVIAAVPPVFSTVG